MTKILVSSAYCVMLSLVSLQAHAQKFGHVNSGNILALMPATTESDSLLKMYRDSLVEVGQLKVKELQKKYMDFQTKYSEGSLSPVQSQQLQADLEKEEMELRSFEEETSGMVAVRRQELLGPIIDQLSMAIDEVGKEGGYTMIFDTSVFNAIVFAQESDDLTELVKAKLNMQ